MYRLIFLLLIYVMACDNSSSNDDDDNGGDGEVLILNDFPHQICAAAATVYNNQIYVFGGSDNYGGDTLYNTIYMHNGTDWVVFDTLPDYNNWDVKLVRDGDNVYLISGWPDNEGVIKKYHFPTKQWTSLTQSIATSDDWGTTVQRVGNKIYHFTTSGDVDEYNISNDQWMLKASNSTIRDNESGLVSAKFNGEIFVTGYGDSVLYKYDPNNDQWSEESNAPHGFTGSALVEKDGKLYFFGGSESDDESESFTESWIYDISAKTWTLNSQALRDPVFFHVSALNGNQLIIIGGIPIDNGEGLQHVQTFLLN